MSTLKFRLKAGTSTAILSLDWSNNSWICNDNFFLAKRGRCGFSQQAVFLYGPEQPGNQHHGSLIFTKDYVKLTKGDTGKCHIVKTSMVNTQIPKEGTWEFLDES
jgi:hypothetical protein